MESQKNIIEESANSSDDETTVEPRRKVVEESTNSSDDETTVEPQRKVVEESASSSNSEKTMEPRRNIVEESANFSIVTGKENLLKRNLNPLKHESGDSSAFPQELTSNMKRKSKEATLETLDENIPSQCFGGRKTPSPKEHNSSCLSASSDFEDNFSAFEKRIIYEEDYALSRNPPHRKGKKGGMRTEKWEIQEESIRTSPESVVANGAALARERRTKLTFMEGENNCDLSDFNGHVHPNDTLSCRSIHLPNPLFVKWLTEWKQDAAEKGLKVQYTYGKALASLKKYPLPLSSGKEAKILEYFGNVMPFQWCNGK
ncbi:crossover junction endonuclease MUS81 [Trichonephila clavipes]|nr:crossover junction endonuclease MUS81 [Trichonephila clavipes]